MRIRLESEKATALFAKRLASALPRGIALGLTGGLGAGKTTLVRYLCGALGVAEPVSSPTYVLQHEYTSPAGPSVEHWDLYRLDSLPAELAEPVDANAIRLIEWADKIPGYSESLDLVLELEWLDEAGGRGRALEASGRLADLVNTLSKD